MGLAWVSKGVNSDVPHETCHLGVNGVYDGVWYIYIYNVIWRVYGIWWYMMVYDGIWWYMMVYDGIWWYMMVYDGIWWYMMVYDDIWWYMMVYGGIWWYMVYTPCSRHMLIFNDLEWSLGNWKNSCGVKTPPSCSGRCSIDLDCREFCKYDPQIHELQYITSKFPCGSLLTPGITTTKSTLPIFSNHPGT